MIQRPLKSFWIACLVACAIGLAVPCAAQETGEQAAEKQPAAAADRIAELILMLDSPKFEQRELATALLVRAGDDAVNALQAVPGDASAEMRLRAAEVLESIQAASFDVKASKFLLEADPSLSYGLPAWQSFRELVGDSRVSKLLFVDSVRCQRRLLQMVDVYNSAEPDERAVLSRAVDALASVTAQQIQEKQLKGSLSELGDFVALLVAASVSSGQAPPIVNQTIETNVHRYVFASHLRQQGYSTCLRRLLAHWIPKSHEDLAGQVMQIAMQHELKTGAVVARRHLKENSEVQVRALALQCISKYGEQSDVAAVVKLLKDDTVIYSLLLDDMEGADDGIDVSYSAPPGFESAPMPIERKRYVVQVNDLALVAAIQLTGGEPAEYFPQIRILPAYGIDTRTIASPADAPERRTARIEAWLKDYQSNSAKSPADG